MNWILPLALIACLLAFSHWKAADTVEHWCAFVLHRWEAVHGGVLLANDCGLVGAFGCCFEFIISHTVAGLRREGHLESCLRRGGDLLDWLEEIWFFILIFIAFKIWKWNFRTLCHSSIIIFDLNYLPRLIKRKLLILLLQLILCLHIFDLP